jgi:hypothetical protein
MAKAKSRTTPNHAPRHLTLFPAQIEALEELCVLTYYSDGFTYTKRMMKLVKSIADRATPAAQHACLAQANAREHAYVAR